MKTLVNIRNAGSGCLCLCLQFEIGLYRIELATMDI